MIKRINDIGDKKDKITVKREQSDACINSSKREKFIQNYG